jgi:pyridinium-3,5-biscarboxylic acid mononucleotide sulfurtransferase
MNAALTKKIKLVIEKLSSYQSALVALSGGVDSSVLLALAMEAVDGHLAAVTIYGPSQAKEESARATEIAELFGVDLLEVRAPEFEEENYLANNADRCYHCKLARYRALADLAYTEAIEYLIDGTNADDLDERRPGLAAARECGVGFPLAEAGITKQDVREIAREWKLPNAEAPSDACLATRLPFGTRIEPELLERIGKAEAKLRRLIDGRLRLRHHGPLARLEIEPNQLGIVADEKLRTEITHLVHEAGYTYVTIDLDGYRTASADEAIKDL